MEYGRGQRAGAGETWLGGGAPGGGRPEMVEREAFSFVETAPPQSFVYATLASIALSFGLFITGRRTAGIFVGLWAPTLISLGLFLKMMRQSRSMR